MRSAWLLLALFVAACGDSTDGGPAGRADAGPGPGLGGDAAAPDGAAPLLDGALADAAPDAAADAGASDAAPPDGRGTLQIQPEEAELVMAAGQPPSLQLQAVRLYQGGRTIAVAPADVEWIVDPPDIGAVAPATGVFTPAGPLGTARVFAQHDGDTAAAVVRILGNEVLLEPGTPEDAPERFATAGERESCGPRLEYPEAFTAFPRNIRGVTWQWAASGHTLFEAEFRVGEQVTRWYTARNELTPGGGAWTRLLDTAAGGQLRFRLRGLGGAGADACAAPEQIYLVDTSKLLGAIYYWSTADSGIMRLSAEDTEPEPFLTPVVAPEIACPACHALSRDGARIAFTRTTFPPFGDLAVSDIDAPRQLAYDPTGVTGYFPSFAPDSEHVVAGSGGNLLIRHAGTGRQVGALPLPQGMVGGSPDWSWDGGRIVAALGRRNVNPLPDVGISLGAIAEWVAGADGQWGEARILVEQSGDQSNDRPAYSPDGRYIAFNRQGTPAEGQMGNPSARLWLLEVGSDAAPIDMARANGQGDLGNSWPKWSPASGRGRLWLAFSSLRDYGHLLRNSGAGDPRPQIWVTGIDPTQAGEGQDPSSPAFWLPFQGIGSGNHIPYWAPYEKQPDDFGN
jgi:hypothetical protein